MQQELSKSFGMQSLLQIDQQQADYVKFTITSAFLGFGSMVLGDSSGTTITLPLGIIVNSEQLGAACLFWSSFQTILALLDMGKVSEKYSNVYALCNQYESEEIKKMFDDVYFNWTREIASNLLFVRFKHFCVFVVPVIVLFFNGLVGTWDNPEQWLTVLGVGALNVIAFSFLCWEYQETRTQVEKIKLLILPVAKCSSSSQA